MTDPLNAVYEKYKHLDVCLGDPEWGQSGDSAAIYGIAGELWRAVKEARENPCEENGCTDIENCDEICQHSRIYSPVQMQQAIAQATKRAREDFVNQLKTTVNCAREMKDFAQCGRCPYRICEDSGRYDCQIDRIPRRTDRWIGTSRSTAICLTPSTAQAREDVLKEAIQHLESKREGVLRVAADGYPMGILDGTISYLESLRTEGGDE